MGSLAAGVFKFPPDVGETGGANYDFVSRSLGAAIVFIGLVAVALKDAYVVGSEPVADVLVFAAGLPVENDIAGEAAVNPKVAR